MEPGRAYLAKKLSEIRQSRNENVDEVGKAVSKSGKTISAWEVGRGQPDADSLIKLCKHFGVPISYFYDDGNFELSAEEKKLVEKYRLLESHEQEAAMRYLDFVYKTKPVFEEHDSTPQDKEE